jgi:hypothetical protein
MMNQASNPEEIESKDDGIGSFSDSSEVEFDSSDSSVKLSAKHIIKKIK